MISISIDCVSPTWLSQGDFMWTSYTATFADFSSAATTTTITLATLPTKTVLHAVAIKHSIAFPIGLGAVTISVGVAGSVDKYASGFDVTQAPATAVGQLSNAVFIENFGAPVVVTATAVSQLFSLNTVTAGSVTIWLLTTTLP